MTSKRSKFPLPKGRGRESGIALMMALGAVLVLTTLAVEFAYNSHVSYSMAMNERDRLRAYYLARSAFQFAKLEISMEKEIRGKFGSQLQQGAVSSAPVCQQFPFSTALLRGLLGGEEGAEAAPQEEKKEEKEKKKAGKEEPEEGVKTGGDLGFLQEGQAKEFLDFEGDFSVSCGLEESKINLNYFRIGGSSSTGSSDPYEEQKLILKTLFSEKAFEPVFGGKREEIAKVVGNIADWVDRNDRINEAPGIEGGYEDSVYVGTEYTYRVKNGKMGSLAELLLVSGVGDDLYNLASPSLTVYGDNKINLCLAEEALIKAVLLKYASGLQGVPPVKPDDEETLKKLVEAVQQTCQLSQDANAIASAVNPILGVAAGGGTATIPLSSMITTDARFYALELTGQSGDLELKIKAVLDTKGNVNEWKTLYFRVQ
ncbi:MAG: general secretion pathway protein GspK [Deltaproteobacteria bacterium]|nr:general secretion pathway protein GspK [Deltaproteobacteria bacterium]